MDEINKNSMKFYVPVKLNNATKAYFFCTDDDTFKIGDKCIVETIRGTEIGEICGDLLEMSTYKQPLELKPIQKRATERDLKAYEDNINDAKAAFKFCRDEIENTKLDMNLISCEYTLDRSKLIFSYIADERVDFRELLKVLAAKFKCRIDLRQVGSRDKAKSIGGIGICGLPLCCSTFLNEFDGISIYRAKNQLLSLNIPKLSGHCGKLICCLKYEDEAYTELRQQFPKIGQKLIYNGEQYRIGSMNVLNRMIKIEKPGDVQFLPLETILKLIKHD